MATAVDEYLIFDEKVLVSKQFTCVFVELEISYEDVDISGILCVDWFGDILKVFIIDFLSLDWRSDGAIVPLRVNLHWNNSWTKKLLLSNNLNFKFTYLS